MSIRVHPREKIVSAARLDLQRLVLDWQQANHDTLTELEEMKIVHEVLGDTIARHLMYGIRFERHGNYDKKGGEA